MKQLIKHIILLAFLLPTSAFAYDFEVDGIYYNVNGTEATVTYKEQVNSYSYNSDYYGNMIIPETVTQNGQVYSVTSIGSNAFYWCSELTSIYIPNSITSISNFAFYGCSGLTNIYIPNSITSIGSFAFDGCSGLTSIYIPNSVTSIGWQAFYGCRKLTTIHIPNSVTSIGFRAFYECSGLNSIYCYATNPPECDDISFSSYSATLHVPAASLADYFTAQIWCNFEMIEGDAIMPTCISINKESIEMQMGEQQQLIATITPANASNKEYIWWSTDTNIVTIDNGIITANNYGECDIIATCFGLQAICHVTVNNRITLDQQDVMLLPNHIITIIPSVAVIPNSFTVTSSNPTVAAARVINGKIQVVGIKEGTTTITIGSSDGTAQPAICLVTVYTELGDANCDGFVNISDVTLLIDYLMDNEATELKRDNADLNGDGNINIADITALIDRLLATGN